MQLLINQLSLTLSIDMLSTDNGKQRQKSRISFLKQNSSYDMKFLIITIVAVITLKPFVLFPNIARKLSFFRDNFYFYFYLYVKECVSCT